MFQNDSFHQMKLFFPSRWEEVKSPPQQVDFTLSGAEEEEGVGLKALASLPVKTFNFTILPTTTK